MKNILHINAKNSYLCEVVSNINDGTNRIVLEIECDTSLNPYLVVGSTSIELSSEVSYYVVQQSELTLGGTFTFYIRDDAHTGNTFTINVPHKIGSNMSLRQISNFEYTVCSASSAENLLKEIMNAVYPVGSIYMSVSSEDPSTLFGGTWERWGGGRVPVGVYENDSDFASANLFGGEKTHKLTVEEMPSHQHRLDKKGGNLGYYDGTGSSYKYSVQWHPESARTDIQLISGREGGEQAHNNMPPYITCYMWKRIA